MLTCHESMQWILLHSILVSFITTLDSGLMVNRIITHQNLLSRLTLPESGWNICASLDLRLRNGTVGGHLVDYFDHRINLIQFVNHQITVMRAWNKCE